MIRVNGTEIAAAVVAAEMQYHPAASREEAAEQAGRALVVRELLLQEARRRGITAPADGEHTAEEAVLARLMAEVVRPDSVSEAKIAAFHARHRGRFRSPDLYDAQHILLAAAPDDAQARAKAEQRCAQLIAELEREPAAFERLAAENSACPSAKSGGHLGQIGRGDTVPEFETYLMALEPGELCPKPVASRYGYHVIRLNHRARGRELPLAAVRERIAAYLAEQAERRAIAHFIAGLIAQARIEGANIDLPRPAANPPMPGLAGAGGLATGRH